MIIPILITPAAALSIEASIDKNEYEVGEKINFTVRVTPGETNIDMSITKAPAGCTHPCVILMESTPTDSSGILKKVESFGTPGFYEITWSASTWSEGTGFYETVEKVEKKTSFTVIERGREGRPLSISVMSDKKVRGQEAIYRPGETGTFNGLVSDSEGNAVEGAKVSTQVTNPSGVAYPVVQKTTDENGYYEVVIKFSDDAATGQWNITATASKDGFQKASDTVYVTMPDEKVLEISVNTDKLTYSRGEGTTISGWVVDGDGNFVEGAEVSIQVLNPIDRPYNAIKTTNEAGYYEVSNSFGEKAITGEWMIIVVASKDGYQEDSDYRLIYYEVLTLGIHSERMRLQNDYKKLLKGHILFSEGMVSSITDVLPLLARDEYGHAGIYMGDFLVPGEEDKPVYKVRDKAQVPLKVYRNGKPKLLNLGDDIIEGDFLIGAVVEARGNGIVFTTVDGMKMEAEIWMEGPANFAWKTTQPPPTPDQVNKICEFALSKVEKTEQGKVKYWIGRKGIIDSEGVESWDCVNLAEAAYEYADLDPTPDVIENRLIYPLPQVMFSLIDTVRHPPLKVIDIIVKSPVKLHLYDSEGRHVGVNPQGVIERDIHSAFYYAEVGEYPQGIAILDVKDDYTLVIEALDEGSFDLIIQDLNVCTSGITKIEFQEVLITKDTQATLKLGSAGNEYLMKIDKDDDGKVDETLEPTSLITTPLSVETAPERIGLTFESRSKPSGSGVQIPLRLNGIEEKIGNMDITISYDPSVLEATEVIKGSLTTNSIFDYNILNQGMIKISLADSQGFSGDGSIAYVKFNVIGSEGSSSHLQIATIIANRAEDDETLEIPTIDGVFRVISMEEGRGDGDGDGEYTALDALYILQMAVEKMPEDLVMDVNGDGSVTSIDARKILRIAVGIESK